MHDLEIVARSTVESLAAAGESRFLASLGMTDRKAKTKTKTKAEAEAKADATAKVARETPEALGAVEAVEGVTVDGFGVLLGHGAEIVLHEAGDAEAGGGQGG